MGGYTTLHAIPKRMILSFEDVFMAQSSSSSEHQRVRDVTNKLTYLYKSPSSVAPLQTTEERQRAVRCPLLKTGGVKLYLYCKKVCNNQG